MALIAEKERTREIMKQTQCLLAPIRKLPDEILGCIFDECCGMNYFNSIGVDPQVDSVGLFRTKPALVLSSVCSCWRRIGLSLPQIWARISFKMTTSWTTDQSFYELRPASLSM
ncbi:hypothetical protein BDP27DRAFT_1340891 [Rhodocollybia butyracea]|uniref:F-box domain-containing protein n=1 Tax=Rhodocollybia butyracea TaxID=206335 RepID=A0A9P5TYE4_9AGAR|nr:hypothetical protein BDP27DRAFT_1340891 [Rhodocollybia butyracea]